MLGRGKPKARERNREHDDPAPRSERARHTATARLPYPARPATVIAVWRRRSGRHERLSCRLCHPAGARGLGRQPGRCGCGLSDGGADRLCVARLYGQMAIACRAGRRRRYARSAGGAFADLSPADAASDHPLRRYCGGRVRLEGYRTFGMENMQRAYVLRRKDNELIFLFEDRALGTAMASSLFSGIAAELAAAPAARFMTSAWSRAKAACLACGERTRPIGRRRLCPRPSGWRTGAARP